MGGPAQHDTNPIGHGTIWAQHGLARSANRAVPCRRRGPSTTRRAFGCAVPARRHSRPERIVPPHTRCQPPRVVLVAVRASPARRCRPPPRPLADPAHAGRVSPAVLAHGRALLAGRPQPAAVRTPGAARRPSTARGRQPADRLRLLALPALGAATCRP